MVTGSGQETDGGTWETVGRLVAWLDSESRHSNEVTLLLRALKITEEAGEVAEAIHGLMGGNPRKGRSHTQEDVERELCDVVLTAMVTLATLTPDAQSVFRRHVGGVAARSLDS